MRFDLCIRRDRRRFCLFPTIHHLHVGHNHPFIPSVNCCVELIVMLQFACSAPADMTLQNPATRPPEYQSKINRYIKSHTAWKRVGAFCGSTGTFRAHRPAHQYPLYREHFFLVSRIRQETWAALGRTGVEKKCLCLLLLSSFCSAPRTKSSGIIWALLVTTAANVETPRFEISCAADFYTTKHLWRLMSSWIFVQMTGRFSVTLRWLKNCNAIYARRYCVHRYPSCDDRDQPIHCSEVFRVSDVSLCVCGMYRWCYQESSNCSCDSTSPTTPPRLSGIDVVPLDGRGVVFKIIT